MTKNLKALIIVALFGALVLTGIGIGFAREASNHNYVMNAVEMNEHFKSLPDKRNDNYVEEKLVYKRNIFGWITQIDNLKTNKDGETEIWHVDRDGSQYHFESDVN